MRPDLPGSVNFGFDVAGRGFKPNDPLSVALDGLSGRLRGLAASGGGKLTHAGDTWTFQQVGVGLGRTHLALDGSIDRTADLRFALTAQDLSLLSASGRGRLQANGTIRGPLASPDIVATAQGTDILYDGVALAQFDAKVDFDPTSQPAVVDRCASATAALPAPHSAQPGLHFRRSGCRRQPPICRCRRQGFT